MRGPTYTEAARKALGAAMEGDDSVYVLGEDVTAGGPFGITKGLVDAHGTDRVRNTPISEGAVAGAAVGLALAGKRPFLDLMFNDFITLASDQLFNNAAKIHFMGGGRYSVPLTIWTTVGGASRWGAHHSQRLDGWFTQVAGLKVLAPSTPAAVGAAVTAALADPDPVVILADRPLLYSRAELAEADASPWATRRIAAGDDVTIATTGRLAHLAVKVAGEAEVSADILDLQRLAPFDATPVIESARRTSRLLILHDEVSCGAIAPAIATAVYDAVGSGLAAPIARVTSPATPVPAGAVLEDAYAVSAERLKSELLGLLQTKIPSGG